MQPVSVIIPTFNRAAFLPRAIRSVLQQTTFDGEIIIVDDGSTDETAQIVQNFTTEYPLKYFFMENRGPAAARNRGVAEAEHNCIAFLDSDDHWYKDKFAKQLKKLLENEEFGISHTAEQWLRRGEHLNQKLIHKPQHGYIFNHCLKLCAVGMSTVLMYKDLFCKYGGFDESLPCCEDYEFWLRLSSNDKFLLIPEPLTVKEGGRDDQLSFLHRVGMDKYRIYALDKLLQHADLTAEQFNLAHQELQIKCNVYGKGCIKHGRRDEGEIILKIPHKYIKDDKYPELE